MKVIWPLIFISYVSLFVFGVSDNIRGPLFPEILKEFNITDAMGSLIFAVSSISSFFSSFFSRNLLRKYNRKSILQSACLGLTFTMLGMAFAQNFYIFLTFSILFGFNSGILGLIPNVLVPLGSTPEKKQQFLSGLHAMYGVASLLAPLIVALVSFLSGNWRYVFAITALAPFSLFIYSLHKDHRPHHASPIRDLEKQHFNKSKNFKPQIFLAIMVSFCVAAEIMISSRLALFMRRTWSFDLEISSLYVTGFFVCMLLGRLLFTGFKFNKTVLFQLSICLIITAIMICLGLLIHPLFLVASGFSVGPYYPLAISFISSEFPDDLDTAVSYMIATDSFMLAIMHLLVGKLTDTFGIHHAIFSSVVFLLLSFLLVNSYEYFFKKVKT